MSQDRPSQTADKYIVRLPDGMRDRIAEAAKSNNRSMNAEIVARLEESFSPTGSDATVKALALRVAQAEFDLHVLTLESDSRLLDVCYAADSAMEAVEFNKHLGYEQPFDDETLGEIKKIVKDAYEVLNQQTPEDFEKTIKELEAAKKRLIALKPPTSKLIRRTRPSKK